MRPPARSLREVSGFRRARSCCVRSQFERIALVAAALTLVGRLCGGGDAVVAGVAGAGMDAVLAPGLGTVSAALVRCGPVRPPRWRAPLALDYLFLDASFFRLSG